MVKEFKCKLCKVSFDANWKLNRHRKGDYGCKYDDVQFNLKTLDNITSIIQNDNISFTQNINVENKCNKCDAIFTLKHNLKRHKINNKCKNKKELLQKKELQKEIKEKTQIENLQTKINLQNEELKKTQKQIQLQNEELQKLQQDKYQTISLPIENKDKFATNFIYLIIEKEYITNNEDIFKIGKTTQKRLKRFDKYKSGSILLSYNRCTDCHTSEKEIIKFFKIKYKQRLDIGLEYFEGNHEDMIDDIYSIIKFNKEPIIKN